MGVNNMIILIYTEERWIDLDQPDIQKNLYEISNYGNIRNKKRNKILKTQVSNAGYKRVILQTGNSELPEKQFSIHRLVALLFVENPDPNKNIVVNHLDGNKLNNFCDNLEWTTPKENIIHAVRNKIHWQYVGESHPNAKFTNEMIYFIYDNTRKYPSNRDVCEIVRKKYPQLDYLHDDRLMQYIGRIRRKERFTKILDNRGSTTIKRNID